MSRNSGICSTALRLVCEVFLLVILFVPVLLFVSQWPSVEHLIQGKVLAVSESMERKIFDEIVFFSRKHV